MFNKEIFAAQTTNGDHQLTTTGSTIVDFFLFAGVYPYKSQHNALNAPIFWDALYADHDTTIRSILKARDCRQGGKLRKIIHDFFLCLEDAAKIDHDVANYFAKCMLAKLPELGYWKDVVRFATTQKAYWYDARKFAVQLMVDYSRNGEHRNLLFKYLPVKFSKGAAFIAHGFGIKKEENWRRFVTPQRRTVETMVCSQNFSEIDYGQVPTQAMKLHKKTFMKFDKDRYAGFLADIVKRVQSGEDVQGLVKSSGNVLPEVINRIRIGLGHGDGLRRQYHSLRSKTVEVEAAYTDEQLASVAVDIAQWAAKAPIDFQGKNIMVLADTSGSMYGCYGEASRLPFKPIDVAISMAIVASESNRGPFKDKFLGFSNNAYMIDLKDAPTVVDKMRVIMRETHCGSTNLMSAFKSILDIAVANNCAQDELPDAIVIPSDQQFNASFGDASLTAQYHRPAELGVFKQAQKMFADAGYRLPRVVYWEVCQSLTKPVTAAEGNVVLLSGFSEQYFTMALTNQINPLEAILEELMKDRYDWKLEGLSPL